MSKAQLGAGNVEIELDGETAVLKPSLRAAQTISRDAGGIMGAAEAVIRLDFDVINRIVALGLGKEPKDTEDQVWRTGISELSPKVNRFLTILANGGRPPKDKGGEGDADPR